MAEGDVAAAERCAFEAFEALAAANGEPPSERSATEIARRSHRIAHLLGTDPGGAWVAESDGEIVGVSLGLMREGIWGLSLFTVTPGYQGAGVGRRLLEPTLEYGRDARGAIILATNDPRAIRRYALAGFDLRPTMDARGVPELSALPDSSAVRPGNAGDFALCHDVGRRVRGASHGPDIEAFVAAGGHLLVDPGRGFAIDRDGSPRLLAALDEDSAQRLLAACLRAAPPGAKVSVEFMTAGQDWAVEVCLAARLSLVPGTPVFVRGELGPMAPYLPSGPYL
jgi:GNAT superfamily N-acetyltransferase